MRAEYLSSQEPRLIVARGDSSHTASLLFVRLFFNMKLVNLFPPILVLSHFALSRSAPRHPRNDSFPIAPGF